MISRFIYNWKRRVIHRCNEYLMLSLRLLHHCLFIAKNYYWIDFNLWFDELINRKGWWCSLRSFFLYTLLFHIFQRKFWVSISHCTHNKKLYKLYIKILCNKTNLNRSHMNIFCLECILQKLNLNFSIIKLKKCKVDK